MKSEPGKVAWVVFDAHHLDFMMLIIIPMMTMIATKMMIMLIKINDGYLASGLYSSHGSPEFSMRKRTPV